VQKNSSAPVVILVVVLALLLVGGLGGFLLWRNHMSTAGDDPSLNSDPPGESFSQPSRQPDGSAAPATAAPPEALTLSIRQVDNSAFPQVTFYSSVYDSQGNTVSGLTAGDFVLKELIGGALQDQTLQEVRQIQGAEKCSVSLVLDASASMRDGDKMNQAKSAAQAFLSQVNFAAGDQVSVVSFSDYVYLNQDFTSDRARLSAAVDAISLYDMTALYDALYAALVQTYAQDGARCVVAFTDGQENGSSYAFDDVAALSRSSGVPVYLIGIGSDYDEGSLRQLAGECSGQFYAASGDLASALAEIYADIYRQQQEYYIFRYTSSNADVDVASRLVELSFADTAPYTGSDSHDYQTQTVINADFGDSFRNRDYMLPNSSVQAVTESDLSGMSLAQLRIARNEIYARHGRQFKDAMLNQWFYSKNWYLSVSPKYSPAVFDQSVNDLSDLERKNVGVIRDYENYLMSSRDIFPNAGAVPLTEYDLALSKTVLNTALQQMRGYPSTDTLRQNIALVEAAVNREEIKY